MSKKFPDYIRYDGNLFSPEAWQFAKDNNFNWRQLEKAKVLAYHDKNYTDGTLIIDIWHIVEAQ